MRIPEEALSSHRPATKHTLQGWKDLRLACYAVC